MPLFVVEREIRELFVFLIKADTEDDAQDWVSDADIEIFDTVSLLDTTTCRLAGDPDEELALIGITDAREWGTE